jgi:hypothetical protein
MPKCASSFRSLFFALSAVTCSAAAPSCAQSYTFTSNGTGTYFTDNLTTGQPHAVDFFSKTSGQSAGKDSTLTITGHGNGGVTYTHNGQFYHENTDLTTTSVLLQDAASGAMIFSLHGPLHYEFVTSPYSIDYLTLAGTVFDAGGVLQNFDFFKDEDGGTVTAHVTPLAVPELAPSVDCGVLLGLTLAAMIWKGSKRRIVPPRG